MTKRTKPEAKTATYILRNNFKKTLKSLFVIIDGIKVEFVPKIQERKDRMDWLESILPTLNLDLLKNGHISDDYIKAWNDFKNQIIKNAKK